MSCYFRYLFVVLPHHAIILAEDDEVDSFMFQSAGHSAIECQAKCLELPLIRRPIRGVAVRQDLQYHAEQEGDEVEDLALLLQDVLVCRFSRSLSMSLVSSHCCSCASYVETISGRQGCVLWSNFLHISTQPC